MSQHGRGTRGTRGAARGALGGPVEASPAAASTTADALPTVPIPTATPVPPEPPAPATATTTIIIPPAAIAEGAEAAVPLLAPQVRTLTMHLHALFVHVLRAHCVLLCGC